MKTNPFGKGTRLPYYILVAFLLVTLLFSGILNYRLGEIERMHLAGSQRLGAILERLDNLQRVAAAIYHRGDESPATTDARAGLESRSEARLRIEEALRTTREAVGHNPRVLASLDDADGHLYAMVERSDRLHSSAGSRFSSAARNELSAHYVATLKSMDRASELVRSAENQEFKRRSRLNQQLAREQALSVVFMVILVLGLVAFGRRLNGAAAVSRAREENVRSLRLKEEQLNRAVAERDAREAEVLHSRQLLMEAQRIARLGAWEWEIATGKVWWSDELYQIFETDRAHLDPSYEAYMGLVDPDDRERVSARISQSLADLMPFEQEYAVVLPTGKRGAHIASGRVEVDETGRPARMFGVAQDITERWWTQEQLSRQEALLQEAQRIAQLGSWQLEVATGAVSWSDELHSILGYSSGDVAPSFRAYMSLIPDHERGRVYRLLEGAMAATITSFEFEHVLRRADGVDITLFVQVAIDRDSSGKAVRVTGNSQDVTARRNAEKELRLSEERFQLVSQATNDIVWDRDLVTGHVWVNESFSSRLGYPQWGNIDANLWLDGVHPSDAQRVAEGLGEALTSDAATWTCQYRFAAEGGEWREVLDRSHIVRDSEGRAIRIIGAMMDISERRAIDRMKDEFISTVSHELRTPLTAIRGALGLLSSGRLGALSEKGQRLLAIASSNTDRLVRLINDILDIERIESGRVTLLKTTCDAAVLARSAADLVHGLAEREHIDIVVDAQPTALLADADRIIQTLTNLLGNAVKFSPAGSTILVSVRTEGPDVLIAVTDHGRGIPPDRLDAIFERFQQVDASDSRDKGGSGLGLTISRSIARQHGGDIHVVSQPGSGSTFTVSIPGGVASASAESLPSDPISTEPPPSESIRAREKLVYVCDDDADMRATLGYFLTRRGFSVVETATGQDLLFEIEKQKPDAILLDLFMPGVNGWETLSRLRSDPASADIPVIIVSVLSQGEVGETDLDFTGWVQKPFDERHLAEVVERAFRGRKQRPRLMLVEDDPDLAAIIVQSFERYGMQTIHARDGQEAIRLASAMEPDLLILDLLLPGIDGYGFVDWLKDHALWPALPLVVYSATEPSPSQKERLRLGRTEFLTKSRVPPDEFERKIVRLIEAMTSSTKKGSITHAA